MPLWLTLVVGNSRIPVYIPMDHDPKDHMPYLGDLARRLDEKEEEWDATYELPSRLKTIGDAKDPKDPRFGALCIMDFRCQDCGLDESNGLTYLREGKVVSLCEKHVRPEDLRLDVIEVRSVQYSPEEILAKKKEGIRRLSSEGKSTREIAKELGMSQSAVQYHLSANE